MNEPIKVRAAVLGDVQLSRVFAQAGSELRSQLADELEAIGTEVVALARAAVRKKTSRTMQRIVYRMGIQDGKEFKKTESGPLVLTVFPGEPIAHLLERGYGPTTSKVYSKVYATKLAPKFKRADGRIVWKYRRPSRVKSRRTFLFSRTNQMSPRPFFVQSTQRVNAGDRLQAIVSKSAAEAVDKFWNA